MGSVNTCCGKSQANKERGSGTGRGLWKMLHWYDIAANGNKIKPYLIFTLGCPLLLFLFSHSFPCDYVDHYDIDFLVCTLRKMSGSSGIIVHRTM